MTTPLVSIIIHNSNHKGYLQDTIHSLIAQTYRNIELILIDNHSIDFTLGKTSSLSAICKNRFFRFILMKREDVKAYGDNEILNGFEVKNLIGGEYLFRISSGDVVISNAVELLVNTCEEEGSIGAAIGDSDFIDEQGNTTTRTHNGKKFFSFIDLQCTYREDFSQNEIFGSYESLLSGNYMSRNFFLRTSAFNRLGYDTRKALSDYYLWLEIAKRYKIKLIKKKLLHERIPSSNSSNLSKIRLTEETLEVLLGEKSYSIEHGYENIWLTSFKKNLLVLLELKAIKIFYYLNELDWGEKFKFLNEFILPFVVQNLKKSRFEEISYFLSHAIIHFPTSSDLLNYYAISSIQETKEISINLIERAIKIQPRVISYYNNLASMYLAKNDIKQAQACFEQVLGLDSRNQSARNHMRSLSFIKRKTVKPLKVAYYSVDDPYFAVSRLRVIDPFTYMRNDFTLLYGGEINNGKARFRLDIIDQADILIVQRSLPRANTQPLIEKILHSKKPIVYETDDLLNEIPEDRDILYDRGTSAYIEGFIKEASALSVATEALKKKYSKINKNTVVLPNFLNDHLWQWKKLDFQPSSPLTIGFCGSKGHIKDLEIIEDVLLSIKEKYKTSIRFSFIGCITEKLKNKALFTQPDFRYHTWPARLNSHNFDFAVVPLQESIFNQSISLVKWLEYSALGIPAIFSNTAEYSKKISHLETGILVNNNEQEWFSAIELLINNRELASDIAKKAHHEVNEHFMLSNRVKDVFLSFYKNL